MVSILFWIIAFAVVGVVALVFVSARKPGEISQPENIDTSTEVDRSCEKAEVLAKYTREEGSRARTWTEYMADFETYSGERLSLQLPKSEYGEIEVGRRGYLTLRFGKYESFGDEYIDVSEELDPFSMEDYDEELDAPHSDVYEPPELFNEDERRMSTEEEEKLEEMLDSSEELPVYELKAGVMVMGQLRFSPLGLIQATGMYPFLRRRIEIQELFADAYRKAVQQFELREGTPRRAKKVERLYWRRNEFQLQLVLTEVEGGLKLEADFSINGPIFDEYDDHSGEN